MKRKKRSLVKKQAEENKPDESKYAKKKRLKSEGKHSPSSPITLEE